MDQSEYNSNLRDAEGDHIAFLRYLRPSSDICFPCKERICSLLIGVHTEEIQQGLANLGFSAENSYGLHQEHQLPQRYHARLRDRPLWMSFCVETVRFVSKVSQLEDDDLKNDLCWKLLKVCNGQFERSDFHFERSIVSFVKLHTECLLSAQAAGQQPDCTCPGQSWAQGRALGEIKTQEWIELVVKTIKEHIPSHVADVLARHPLIFPPFHPDFAVEAAPLVKSAATSFDEYSTMTDYDRKILEGQILGASLAHAWDIALTVPEIRAGIIR